MTKFTQPISSLGMLLHENLVNLQLKKNAGMINFRDMGIFDLFSQLYPAVQYLNMYLLQGRSAFQVSINFLPAHILFYFDDVVGKLYDVDLVKPPNELWLDFQKWKNHGDEVSEIIEHPETQDPLDTPNMVPIEENVEEINQMEL